MRKKVMALFVVLLALAWYQTIKTAIDLPAEYQEHIRQAEEYAKKGIYEDALEEYRLALSIRPGDQELQLVIAQTELELGDKSSFIVGCEALIDAEPMNEKALVELVDYYSSDGKREQIVSLLKELRNREPENATVEELWKTYRGSYEALYRSYEWMSSFYGGYAVAGNENGYIVIDMDGERIFSDKYEEIGFVSADSGLIPVKKNGSWYYVNGEEHKKLVPNVSYDSLGTISEECLITEADGRVSFTDTQFQPLTDLSWEAASNMYHDVAAVCENGTWALLSSEMEFLTEYIYEDIAIDEMGFCSEGERIFAKQKDGWHLLDAEGAVVTTTVYEDAGPFGKDGLAAVCQNGQWGYVNVEGELVIDYQYEDAGVFQEGFAPVKKNDRWGYIDAENEMVIEPVFEEAHPFCENGTAPVKDENWFLIRLYAL